MKQFTLLLALFFSIGLTAQCTDIETNYRPDGNTIKYFNPKSILKQTHYEVGASIYYNQTTKTYFVNIAVLFKTLNQMDISGDLLLQLNNSSEGISLKRVVSDKIQMNGRNVSIAMYEIDKRSYNLLSKYSLKSLYFTMNNKTYGSTVTENNSLFINQLKCF